MVRSNLKNTGVVLPDLTQPNRFTNKVSEILASASGSTADKYDPNSLPYNEPELISYVVKKGEFEGQRKFVFQFQHKANPAWSRSYDLTDLELLVSAIDDLRPALDELRKAPKLKKKA